MAETIDQRRTKVEFKIEGKLGTGELILRQGAGEENMELTLCQNNTVTTFYVGTEEFARVVRFMDEVNRDYDI